MTSYATMLALMLWATVMVPHSIQAAACPLSPAGYYQPPTPGGPYKSGLPPATSSFSYITKPDSLSCSELEQVHQLCVARINEYRAGTRKFSNGQSDPSLGSPSALKHASGLDKCHSEISMGDFALMGTCGAGAHKNAWSCNGYGGSWGQNLCCARGISGSNTFQSLVDSMYACLQSMWDEGIDPTTGVNGHWENMRDSSFKYVSCGFAFATGGSSNYVLMTQNFGGSYSGSTSPGTTPTTAPPTKTPTAATTTNPPTAATTTNPPSAPPSTAIPVTSRPTTRPPSATFTRAPTRRPTAYPTRRRWRRRGLEGEEESA